MDNKTILGNTRRKRPKANQERLDKILAKYKDDLAQGNISVIRIAEKEGVGHTTLRKEIKAKGMVVTRPKSMGNVVVGSGMFENLSAFSASLLHKNLCAAKQ